jgi:hypothetical protein
MSEQRDEAIWAAVEGLMGLHPLNAMSAMLLYFEAARIPVTRNVATDKTSVDWHIDTTKLARLA